MAKVDIAERTKAVGNALTSVSVENMILDMAKGIAWGQYELDKVGVKVTKMMGAPGTVSIGGENLSMLEAGFIPSFYHFVDTILELKMEVKIREEERDELKTSEKTENRTEAEVYASVHGKYSSPGKKLIGGFEGGFKAGFKAKTSNAYTKTVDATHSQQFSQELNASSLMRTKLVPKPAPDMLVERIKMLVDKLREDAEDGAEAEALVAQEATENGPNEYKLDASDPEVIKNAGEKLLMESVAKDLLDKPEEEASAA